jgi:hypothetical protein
MTLIYFPIYLMNILPTTYQKNNGIKNFGRHQERDFSS